jgi:hypothetical protein
VQKEKMEYCIVFNSTRSLFHGLLFPLLLLLWLLFPQLPLSLLLLPLLHVPDSATFVTAALAPASPVATAPLTAARVTAASLAAD